MKREPTVYTHADKVTGGDDGGPLFGGAPDVAPAQQHSPTSVAAGRHIEPDMGRLRSVVLGFIRACGPVLGPRLGTCDDPSGGATDHEIAEGLQMDPSTERPRRIELVKAGKVLDSGVTRKTPSGREATIWCAK